MDAFNKPQLMMWTIIGLVVLNLMAMGTIWWSQQHPAVQSGFQPPQPRARGLHILEEQLNLNEEQTRQLKNYRRQHFMQLQMLEHETHEARRALNEQLFHPDGSSIEELTRIIGEKQIQLELARFEHFQQIASICNEEQKKRLRDLLSDIANAEPRPPHPAGIRRGNLGEQTPPPPGMPPRIE